MNILYFLFFAVILVILLPLLRVLALNVLPDKLCYYLGVRDWSYYEDEFYTNSDKIEFKIRICNLTDKVQKYNEKTNRYETTD